MDLALNNLNGWYTIKPNQFLYPIEKKFLSSFMQSAHKKP